MKLIDIDSLQYALSAFREKADNAYAKASHGTHLTLGTGSGNAYRGDYGNTAYTHSQAAHAPSNAQKNSDITKAEIEAKLTGTISTHSHTIPKSGNWWNNGYINIGTNGVSEIGKYLDFHNTNDTTNDFSTRLYCNGDTKNELKLPTTTGTLARIEDNVASANKLLCNTGRSTSANITATGDKSISYLLATSSMTTGKPFEDGKIIHMEWDNTNGYSSQLYIGHGADPKLQIRGMNGGTWGSWNTVYATNNKPTASDVGAAPTSHASTGTTYGVSSASNYGHAMASGTTPKANGTAAVGSETAKFARGDHVHPLQTTVSGNAGTATKLATARNLTIGNTAKSFDGSAAVSWSHSEIGVPRGNCASAVTAATAQWYRIASTPVDQANNLATFSICGSVSSYHSSVILVAGVTYGKNPTLIQLGYTNYGAGLTKARIVYHTTYSGSYAYLELYLSQAKATTISVDVIGKNGWTLMAPSTVGSIPSGYTSKELTFTLDKIVANIQGNVSGSSGSCTGNAATATKVGTNLVVKLNGGSTEGTNLFTFNGSAAKTINITPSAIGAAASSHGTHLTIGTGASNAAAGNHTHNYAGSSSAGGAANSVKTNLVIKLNGGSTEGTNLFTFNGGTAKTINITPDSIGAAASSHGTHLTIGTGASNAAAGNHTHSYAPTSHASTATTYGVSSASNYGHAMASGTTPKVAGTAAVGSETAKFARGDHVHPLQTTLNGFSLWSGTKAQYDAISSKGSKTIYIITG